MHLEKQQCWGRVRRAGPAEVDSPPSLPTTPWASPETWALGGPAPQGSFTPLLLPRPLWSGCPTLSHLSPTFSPPFCLHAAPSHCLPESSPQPPVWTWTLLPLFPLHGAGSQPSASSPLTGLLTPGCSLASPWQGEGSGVLRPTGRAAVGGEAWGGVRCTSEQCRTVGPGQQGGGGDLRVLGTYLWPCLGPHAPPKVCHWAQGSVGSPEAALRPDFRSGTLGLVALP